MHARLRNVRSVTFEGLDFCADAGQLGHMDGPDAFYNVVPLSLQTDLHFSPVKAFSDACCRCIGRAAAGLVGVFAALQFLCAAGS